MPKYRDISYAYCIEYVSKYGIKSKTDSPPLISVANASDNTNKNQKEKKVQSGNKEKREVLYTEDSFERLVNRFIEKEGAYGKGLLHYKEFWEGRRVDIFINGNMITGTPIFTDKNTLRVVNDNYSYFIPLDKVDYIRTTDGLKPDVGL